MSVMKLAIQADRNITGKRFCSSCQLMKPAEYGEIVGNKVKRWKCSTCLNKASIRRYKSKED